MEMTTMIGFAIVAAVTLATWFVVRVRFADRRIAEAQKKAEEIERSAQQEAERLKKAKLVEAKDQIFDLRSEAQKEMQERRSEFNQLERRLSRTEDNLQSKEQAILRNEKDSNRRLKKLCLLPLVGSRSC